LERSVTADRSEPTGLSVVKARSTYRYDDAQNVQRIYTQQRGWVRYTQMLWMGLKMKAAYLPGC
jgi:hypothetical protein